MGEPSRRKSNARTSNPSTQFHHTHHVTDRSKAMSEDRSRVSQQQVHNPRKFLRKVQKATENRQPTTPLNSMVDGTNKPDALPIRNRHGQDNFRGVCQTVYHNRNLCSALSFKPARVKEIGSIDSVVPTCVHGQNTSDKRRPKSARSAHHRPGRFLSQGLSQNGYGGLKPPTRQANDIRYSPFVRKKNLMLLAASTIEEVGCCFLLVTVSNKTPQSDLQAMFGMLKWVAQTFGHGMLTSLLPSYCTFGDQTCQCKTINCCSHLYRLGG